jgi:hypothetical protein
VDGRVRDGTHPRPSGVNLQSRVSSGAVCLVFGLPPSSATCALGAVTLRLSHPDAVLSSVSSGSTATTTRHVERSSSAYGSQSNSHLASRVDRTSSLARSHSAAVGSLSSTGWAELSQSQPHLHSADHSQAAPARPVCVVAEWSDSNPALHVSDASFQVYNHVQDRVSFQMASSQRDQSVCPSRSLALSLSRSLHTHRFPLHLCAMIESMCQQLACVDLCAMIGSVRQWLACVD